MQDLLNVHVRGRRKKSILGQIWRPVFCEFFRQNMLSLKLSQCLIEFEKKEGFMKMMKTLTALILITFQVAGCASYKSQYVSFRPPEAYANKQEAGGVAVGAEAYTDSAEAKEAFGFDIRDTGLLPVQLVMNNLSGNTIQIVTDQTFLVDGQGRYWQVMPNSVVVERVEKSTQLAALGKGAGTGAFWGAAGGAILGAALGIVSGQNVGNAMGKGVALGAAGGAVIGTAKESGSNDRQISIVNDIRSKGLEGKFIPRDHLANGFLYFPGEAKSAKVIKLQFRENEGGKIHKITLNL